MGTSPLPSTTKLDMDNLNSEKYFVKSQAITNIQLANQVFVSELSLRCTRLGIPVTASCVSMAKPRTGLVGWIDRVTSRGASHPVVPLATVQCGDYQTGERLWTRSATLSSIRQEELWI